MKFWVTTIWLLFGFLNYGLLLGGFTDEFPYMDAHGPAIFGAIGGPLGTPAALIFSHGKFRLKGFSREERWQIFNKKYEGYLDREYFDSRYY